MTRNVLKAFTTKEHYEKYRDMSKAIDLDLSKDLNVLGLSKAEVLAKFEEDEHLNSIPLYKFDAWSDHLRSSFHNAKINYSISNGVCCIKHQIIYGFLGAEFNERK